MKNQKNTKKRDKRKEEQRKNARDEHIFDSSARHARWILTLLRIISCMNEENRTRVISAFKSVLLTSNRTRYPSFDKKEVLCFPCCTILPVILPCLCNSIFTYNSYLQKAIYGEHTEVRYSIQLCMY